MANKLANTIVAKSIPKLYLHSDSADVFFVFTTDNKIIKVPAHKAILAIENPVFEAMFFGKLKENEVIDIVDFSANAFKEFLQFYLSEVTITMENIEEITRLADKYGMLEAYNSCVAFIQSQLTKDNMIWGYQLAISLNNQSLKQFCEGEIKMLTKSILKSDMFLHFGDKSVVERILNLDSLICSELDLFTACIEWAKSSCQANGLDKNDPGNLRNQLGDCFHLIRFETMKLNEIGMILGNEQYRQLFSPDEMADIVCMKSDANFESNTFKHTQRPGRAIEWNNKAVLTCDLLEHETYIVNTRKQESTWFSVNVPVLLGEIKCRGVYECVSDDVTDDEILIKTSFKMSIIEYEKVKFPATDVLKVVYTQEVNYAFGKPSVLKILWN